VFPKRSIFLNYDNYKIHKAQDLKTTRKSRIVHGKFFEMLVTGGLIKTYQYFSANSSICGVFFIQKIL